MTRETIRIAAFGDVVGAPGRHVLEKHLLAWRMSRGVDLVLVNGENVADGSGVTPPLMDKLLKSGADVITTGDHVGRKNAIFPTLVASPKIVRPANYPDAFPGRGLTFVQLEGIEVGVLNVIGRVFMQGEASCPFKAADEAWKTCQARRALLVVDFHAEATSEKIAMGWHLDGRASFSFGSHTHVQTADERVLPGGTAYITDLGMTGPHDGVIGRKKERVLRKLLTGVPTPFDVAEGDERACGALCEVEVATGRARWIERVVLRIDDPVSAEVVSVGAAAR